MKLYELAAANPKKQTARVFESYFGDRITFDTLTGGQAQRMLHRVRGLIAEHRRTPEFHRSQQNPAYLKLVMMEQALTAHVREDGAPNPVPQTGTVNTTVSTGAADSTATQGLQAAQIQQQKKTIQDQIKQHQDAIRTLQQQLNNPTMESRRARRLREASEIQQAQVVLASQDMVDKLQKMLEQVSSMQFKDLPALCDQIKNEIGAEQGTQFGTDAGTALATLIQGLQGGKQQLEQALGVVTGQEVQIPGMGAAGAMPDVSADEMGDVGGMPDMPDMEEPAEEPPVAGLGRERR